MTVTQFPDETCQRPSPSLRKPLLHRTWARVIIAVIGIFTGLALLASLTAKPAAVISAPRTATSAQAPVQSTQVPVSTTPAATVTSQIVSWQAGSGQASETAMTGILGQIGTDAGNQDLTATETDGATLVATADQALSGPVPPVGGAAWTAALTDYKQAGEYLSQGDLTDATSYITQGTTQIQAVTAAFTAAGA